MEYVKQPKTKRGEQTLKKICEAAEALFAQKGYYATEISDITHKAQVATGTLYVYFPDKLSLFLHLMDNLGRKLRRAIRLAKQESPHTSIIEQERISIRVWFSFVREHFGLFRIVWQAQFVDEQAFKDYYERFSQGYIGEITKAKEKGEAREMDPALLSYALMGIYSFVALKCFVFDKSEPDDSTINQLVDFIAHGMLRE
ncbi:MAG: TetR/AcrR family transcriptional regulator [Defluviitaleaceae bacterium]|nr:TetR/AcrR family transcriptional regulator [Defluviitaleaceae bacterium]MCL2239587.1 TetR/AcrR family transcriptional regulator [Defluviitaleaceae bacterium]